MLFSLFIFASAILFAEILSCSIEERPCTTANGTEGYCAPSKYCPYINRLIGTTNPEALDFITNSICGHDVDKSRLFCCDINILTNELHGSTTQAPTTTNNLSKNKSQSNLILNGSPVQEIIISTTTSPIVNQSSTTQSSTTQSSTTQSSTTAQSVIRYCQTPNGDRAQCISIYNCPTILSILESTTDGSERRYLRESKCGFKDGIFLVCCGLDVNFKNFQEEDEANRNFKYNDLIPRNNCGVEVAISEEVFQPVAIESRLGQADFNFTVPTRIFGGTDTDINEFPWLALLEFVTESGGQRSFSCGGSLISSRYVLTAAHCLITRVTQRLVNVRLGEWNHNDEEASCVSTNKGRRCIGPPIDVLVDSLHIHPEYRFAVMEKYHDIGLVRLDRDVPFTNHIRPICLPNPDDYLTPGERLTISGWGLKSYNEVSSIKQKVDVPIIAVSQCSLMFEKHNRLRKIGRGQICAGGEQGKDSCVGDSGAPLMRRSNATLTRPAQWTVEGIVSFGQACGVQNLYGVYTKVPKYLAWIHKTIVP